MDTLGKLYNVRVHEQVVATKRNIIIDYSVYYELEKTVENVWFADNEISSTGKNRSMAN